MDALERRRLSTQLIGTAVAKAVSPRKRAERLVTQSTPWVVLIGGMRTNAGDSLPQLRRILAREFRRAERRGARRALRMAEREIGYSWAGIDDGGNTRGGLALALLCIKALAAELGKRKRGQK